MKRILIGVLIVIFTLSMILPSVNITEAKEVHAYGSWSSINSSQHRRTCTTCGASEYAAHTLSGWSSISSSQHRRVCTICGYSETSSHNYGGWSYYSSSQCRRSCGSCGYAEYGNHTYSGSYCTKCGWSN